MISDEFSKLFAFMILARPLSSALAMSFVWVLYDLYKKSYLDILTRNVKLSLVNTHYRVSCSCQSVDIENRKG